MQQDENLDIVYHHKGILIVNKPSGLASQPTRDDSPNLFDTLKKSYGYVALHHRLDTPASGLVLLCTDKKWNKYIAQAFQRHQIQRKYWVACLGKTAQKGTWDSNIDGKRAITLFETTERLFGYSCLGVQLQTGRKHQIRIHAKRNGHPVLGDRRYGGGASRLCKRLALHATQLDFTHPATKEHCTVHAPLPKELQSLLSK